MLNVPEVVKTLFKTDSVKKNFRVHFPNGEMDDIRSDSIVFGSVSFTESVCSRSSVSFGLAEGSKLTFETVGIGDMFQMVIECAWEVDASSLNASEIEDIETGNYDGAYVSSEDSDLPFAYYSIPLGRFVVDSCPRSAGEMTHRRVTAYTRFWGEGNNDSMPAFETWKGLYPVYTELTDFGLSPNFDFNLTKMIYGNVPGIADGWDAEQVYDGLNFSGNLYSPTASPSVPLRIGRNTVSYGEYYVDVYGGLKECVFGMPSSGTAHTDEDVYKIKMTRNPDSTYFQTLNEVLTDVFGKTITQILADGSVRINATLRGIALTSNGAFWQQPIIDSTYQRRFTALDDEMVFYPYVSTSRSNRTTDQGIHLALWAPLLDASAIGYFGPGKALIRVMEKRQSGDDVIVEEHEVDAPFSDVKMYRLTRPAAEASELDDVTIKVKPAFEGKTYYSGQQYTYQARKNAFDFRKLVDGYFELGGKFVIPNRATGGYKVAEMEKTVVETIDRSQYESCWWDEYDILPVQAVRYSYIDDDEKKQEATVFTGTDNTGSEFSLYDMSGNYVLTQMNNPTLDKITAIINEKLMPNIQQLLYTPVELDAVALPYLETTDYIEVQTGAEDVPTVQSFVLRRDMSGQQHLTDSIDSVSGVVTGFVED